MDDGRSDVNISGGSIFLVNIQFQLDIDT